MSKPFNRPKNFRRFNPSQIQTLLLYQGFSFGVHNSRLKLKGSSYKFRNTDVLTVLIIGECGNDGCKVSDFKNILGSDTCVTQNVLTRTSMRGLIYKQGGKKGRGYAAKYYLDSIGFKVYETLKKEMGNSFRATKEQLTRQIARQLNINLIRQRLQD